MKFLLEIELGNAAMKSVGDVRSALYTVVERLDALADETPGDETPLIEKNIADENGNRVGWWAFAEGFSVQKDPKKK